MAGATVEPKILRDPPTRLETPPDRTHHAATPAHERPPTIRRFVPSAAAQSPMPDARRALRRARWVRLQLELGQERGATPLPVRAAGRLVGHLALALDGRAIPEGKVARTGWPG
jgi:hypothetical protein